MSLRRTVSWSTAMHDHRRERIAPSGPSPMFARAREIDARRAERRAALEAERCAASAGCEEVNKT